MNNEEKAALLSQPPIQVLDRGFVRLVDFMGDDSRIVQCARVSTGAGTKTPEEDRNLIRYMFRHRHTTPFEMVRFTFHAKHPIFVARQWVRHRMASINEMSGRYRDLPEEFYIPERFRLQSKTNKQGGDDEVDEETNERMRSALHEECTRAFKLYHQMLEAGISNEMARFVLPVNTYTEWYWTTDLHNLFNFLALRTANDAQWETRQYALAIEQIVEQIVPVAWSAYIDYRRTAMSLSAPEIEFLRDVIVPGSVQVAEWDGTPDSVSDSVARLLSSREHAELNSKFDRLFWELS